MKADHNTDVDQFAAIKAFYDQIYYKNTSRDEHVRKYYRRLAQRLGIRSGDNVLDVACGTGEWLQAVQEKQALVSGIDISERAVETCRTSIPEGNFALGPAEQLPFHDSSFDWITCLGSLEHFLDKKAALAEMLRVGKAGARYVILVPNAGFLTRRLGLFHGTEQAAIREDVLDLDEWQSIFENSGLTIHEKWADLHVLSMDWITRGRIRQWPLRFAQAIILTTWPLRWQYQVFHLCVKTAYSEPS